MEFFVLPNELNRLIYSRDIGSSLWKLNLGYISETYEVLPLENCSQATLIMLIIVGIG